MEIQKRDLDISYLQNAPDGFHYKIHYEIELKRNRGRPRIFKDEEMTKSQLNKREYHEKNKEKRREYCREYFHKNKERIDTLRKERIAAKKLNSEQCKDK